MSDAANPAGSADPPSRGARPFGADTPCTTGMNPIKASALGAATGIYGVCRPGDVGAESWPL